jgi:hypothetical protein
MLFHGKDIDTTFYARRHLIGNNFTLLSSLMSANVGLTNFIASKFLSHGKWQPCGIILFHSNSSSAPHSH